MKLYYAPNACSLGIHVLLEEIGKPFELLKVDLAAGAQYKEPYASLNPKSKVPALLRDDNSLVTEWPAIAWYLAKTNPEARLLPETIEGEVRTLELLDYMVATVHMRGFTRMFRPAAFTPTSADEPAVKQTGRDIVTAGYKLLNQALGAKAYLLGDYSIADAALFFLENWGPRANLELPEGLAGHLERMRARPAVQRALKAEGLA
ncbi:glutathione S-transferase [Acidocella sp.]|uniref:glutathione S-transferase n=1 Tax=Acidocella sp. TaxID=50710 RepID=UPI0026197757|nr:glutathione S-transferase [Acidocella sp.]